MQVGVYRPTIPAYLPKDGGMASSPSGMERDGPIKNDPSLDSRASSSPSAYTEKSVSNDEKTSNEEGKKKEADGSLRRPEELTPEERQLLSQLQARDTQVRAHEMAHLAAAGGIATGGASYTYQRGPDGRMYAVGGEVPIAVSKGKDPEETVQKMRQVVAAAMAPADPSSQDYAVAANARVEEMKALQELREAQMEAMREDAAATYEKNGAGPSSPQEKRAAIDVSV